MIKQFLNGPSVLEVDTQPTLPVETPGAKIEEQPTETLPLEPQHAQLEEQSTLVLPVEQDWQMEELSTLVLPVDQRLTQIAEQATLALPLKRGFSEQQIAIPASLHPSKFKRRWLIFAVLYFVLIGGGLIGRAAVVNWIAAKSANLQSTPVVLHVHRTAAHSSAIDSAANNFMQAMMNKDWESMWSMLSPDAQRSYQGEQDFARFEQAKFGAIRFTAFKLSASVLQQPWLDPDTTYLYPIAATLQVSLSASAPQGVLTGASLADLDNGLFQNTPFALVPRNGQWLVAVAGPADLDAPILAPALLPHTRLQVPIFMYHHVSNELTHDLLDYTLTVTTTEFNAQLDWLQAQGYSSINMTELFDALYYGKALPPHPMILSFDDGYEDMYTDAVPTLLAHHYRGVFYIITGMIGGRYMTWNQVRTLDEYGMQIASHTVHHINIGNPPAYTSTQQELLDSKNTLQAQLGKPVQFFCYPTGEPFHNDSNYERQLVLADLLADGYIGATLDPLSFDSTIQDAQTPYQLPRVRVSGGESLQSFTGILDSVLKYDAWQLA
ncbi:MAG TPA: polysaccharide deacetylase family protein [Ktedonobacteraceae bacterium]